MLHLYLVVGRLIANSIAQLALGRVPINRTCLQSLDLISSMYFVPHFGHAKVYETSIWTPCFQISAKTLILTWVQFSQGHISLDFAVGP